MATQDVLENSKFGGDHRQKRSPEQRKFHYLNCNGVVDGLCGRIRLDGSAPGTSRGKESLGLCLPVISPHCLRFYHGAAGGSCPLCGFCLADVSASDLQSKTGIRRSSGLRNRRSAFFPMRVFSADRNVDRHNFQCFSVHKNADMHGWLARMVLCRLWTVRALDSMDRGTRMVAKLAGRGGKALVLVCFYSAYPAVAASLDR